MTAGIAPATICAHNAEGQTLIVGSPVPCRKCGAPLEPSPSNTHEPVNAGYVNASYPALTQA